ncbi:Pkinase-domain-containing protein [Saitoella complicata NRRL Y-17804]|nr:Pkinase-domain-containing protein [Saitoella complicata NRRL Y-17804]ODQ54643.1 Pkinase-domain-containing protein [Saitoella complicata NRRL Y-17804]
MSKRKNFKKLNLPASPATPAPPAVAQPAVEDAVIPGSRAEQVYLNRQSQYHNKLSEQLATLELGVEFKLDLKEEDIEVQRELGAGNGGTVSRVLHKPTRTIMARKIIHIEAKPATRKQILRELQIMYDCSSPHIVSFYGAILTGPQSADVAIFMEHMDAGSLDRISKLSPLPPRILRAVTRSVMEGLGYLYNVHRIIHRDIKPSNVLVNRRGEVKLCDFGVSGELINSIADTFVGTSTYMSPERIQGAQYSVKSDVWSFGITLIELAAGSFPFPSSAGTPLGILDLLQQIVHEPAPTLPELVRGKVEYVGPYVKEGEGKRSGDDEVEWRVDRSLKEVVAGCLDKDPEARWGPEVVLKSAFMMDGEGEEVDLGPWARSTMKQ